MIDINLTDEERVRIIKDPQIRKKLAYESHQWFFSLYLSRYIIYPFAAFHKEIFEITENESINLAVITAFRGASKSTLCSLSYPIWSIIGNQKKKFVLLLTQTQSQAKILLGNIKRELEKNELLKMDVGPFEEDTEWTATSIVLSRYNARIMVASSEQSIRGVRHDENRPDLIICDDLEDLASVKTQENRDKTYERFTGDIVPAGSAQTKIIIIGNLLHEDSLIMRLKKNLEEKKTEGIFRAYPIVDDNNKPLWSGKYPNVESIEKARKRVGSETAWQREYMLRLIPDDTQIVHPVWIHYYDEIPDPKYLENGYRFSALGIDLAISENSNADCTAIIAVRVFGHRDSLRVYILPHPINLRLDFPKTVSKVKELAGILEGKQTKIFIEKVAYQQALADQLQEEGYKFAEGIPLHGQDKRARLTLTTDCIQMGKILFPRYGAEALIQQLVGFGVEKYDDLADAFSILILKILEIGANQHIPYFKFLDLPNNSSMLPDLSQVCKSPPGWNDPEQRKKLELEADLKIIREQEARVKSGWY